MEPTAFVCLSSIFFGEDCFSCTIKIDKNNNTVELTILTTFLTALAAKTMIKFS